MKSSRDARDRYAGFTECSIEPSSGSGFFLPAIAEMM